MIKMDQNSQYLAYYVQHHSCVVLHYPNFQIKDHNKYNDLF